MMHTQYIKTCGLTHCLVLHAREDDVKHLRERGLGRRLVDEVLGGKVDVVARAHCLQHGALVHFARVGRDHRQQGLWGGRAEHMSTFKTTAFFSQLGGRGVGRRKLKHSTLVTHTALSPGHGC